MGLCTGLRFTTTCRPKRTASVASWLLVLPLVGRSQRCQSLALPPTPGEPLPKPLRRNGYMLDVGTAAEHLVCADLIMHGFNAFMSSAGLPYDVVFDAEGEFYRVAVKSTLNARLRLARKNPSKKTYQFNILRRGKRRYTLRQADLVALVGIDRKLIAYLAVEECPTIMHLDHPDEWLRKTNSKGKTPHVCRVFDDFPLYQALQRIK